MTREALLPGVGYINETGTRQALLPGVGYINESVSIGGGGGGVQIPTLTDATVIDVTSTTATPQVVLTF